LADVPHDSDYRVSPPRWQLSKWRRRSTRLRRRDGRPLRTRIGRASC
jgi:hypothetical protein